MTISIHWKAYPPCCLQSCWWLVLSQCSKFTRWWSLHLCGSENLQGEVIPCQTFVTTYMSFVSQLLDPWDIPSKQALEVMQTVWNATSGNEYQITTSTVVYVKFSVSYITNIFYRPSNISPTCGEMSLAPLVLLWFLLLWIPKKSSKTLMKTEGNLLSTTLQTFTFYTRILTMKIRK